MNSERTAQLRVALASYDLKELRVQKRYLQEQGSAIECTCFCSGEKLLQRLQQNCVEEVKRINGAIWFEESYRYQHASER